MTVGGKVAYIVGQLGLGGAEQQLYFLLSHLDRNRFPSFVISLAPRPDEFWAQQIELIGVPIFHLPQQRLPRLIGITKLLRGQTPAIVHSWDYHTNPYAVVAGKLVGVDAIVGSLRSSVKAIGGGPVVRTLGRWGVVTFVANSAYGANELKRKSHAQVEHIPNGVNIPVAEQNDSCALKARLGFSKTERIIGSIGRLDENKNHQMLIRVFARLANQYPNLRLLLIGAGRMKDRLTSLARELAVLERVKILPPIPKASEYLSAFEVFCLCSLSEGMPNVVMEACAAGVPVVATRVGGTGELVENGENGFLVQPNDDDEMYGDLQTLLADPAYARSMGAQGRQKMQTSYSVNVMVNRMMELYSALLGAKA